MRKPKASEEVEAIRLSPMIHSFDHPRESPMRLFLFLFAVAVPMLLNVPWPPEVVHANQMAAIFGWGLLMCLMPASAMTRSAWRAVMPVLTVLVLAAAGCALSIAFRGLPTTPGFPMLVVIVFAALVLIHGTATGLHGAAVPMRAMAVALVAAAAVGAGIGVVQIFAPQLIDWHIVALATSPGRAVGNLGQANHFADSQLWGLVALVPLFESPRISRSHALRALLIAIGVLLLVGITLSSSRAGLVGVALIAAWGALDRGLTRSARLSLVGTLVVTAVLYLLYRGWTQVVHIDIGYRSHADISSFRFEIWGEVLQLIAQHPWIGTGWGQLNFAWTLTPFADRHTSFVDNAHDLPLHLAVELGIPCAVVMIGLLLFAGWNTWRRLRRLVGGEGVAARSAAMLVVIIGFHNLLEYPLWYVYFLFPALWAWGLALGRGAATVEPSGEVQPTAAPPRRIWSSFGALLMVCAFSAWLDYLTIVALYLPSRDAAPFPDRIRSGQASPLFSNLADYVYATQLASPNVALPEIVRSSHVLLNARLLFLWSNVLAQQGDIDKARYMAARLREFDLSGPRPFFAPCDDPAVKDKPFQCLPPLRPLTWQDFR